MTPEEIRKYLEDIASGKPVEILNSRCGKEYFLGAKDGRIFLARFLLDEFFNEKEEGK